MERVDCVIVGAGVIGLAIARSLALLGREVIVLERGDTIGSGISSRNSEVIHAGMYYPKDSLKSRFCVAGNAMLRAFAETNGVPFRKLGKLIVATDADEEAALAAILVRGRDNGVTGLRAISSAEAVAMEPALHCTAALFSSDTGIVDSHAYMLALEAEAESRGATVVLHSPVEGGTLNADRIVLSIGGASPFEVEARTLVIAAGLASCAIARSLSLPRVPPDYLCKGSYFSLSGKMPFSRLVYPVPVHGGLGVHYTIDLAGRGRFGPDVEWIEHENYSVDPSRCELFYAAIRRYWPDLADSALEPAYCGIRPKISSPGEPAADFRIDGPNEHGLPNVVALYGIESPGLTSSLPIADYVARMVA